MQLIAPLPLAAIVALAIAVYALWGIALPMLPNAGTSWLLSFNTEGAIFAGAIILARAFPVIEARLRRHRLELTTDLRQLSAREFEQLVGEMFRQEGWDVTETGRHGEADGGIDLRLTKGSEQRLVQCKRWTSYSVGVDEVRQLGGILLAEGLPGAAGVIVTTAEFTKAAAHAAQQLGLEIVDGEALVPRLKSAGATRLLKPARQPDTPWLCPDCETPMVLDHSPYGWWLHCRAYRSGCDGKLHLGRDAIQALDALRRAG